MSIKGTVKWFNNAKGYGFICTDKYKEDIFAHFSCIIMDGYKTLKAGQIVEFDMQQGPKGLHATNVRPTDDMNAEFAVDDPTVITTTVADKATTSMTELEEI